MMAKASNNSCRGNCIEKSGPENQFRNRSLMVGSGFRRQSHLRLQKLQNMFAILIMLMRNDTNASEALGALRWEI
ncbi:unnamed protein product [Pocillopora meandrina]|uniref:Uncharacterized protein n=1 Tax=Pocillopora meandrina TaxID=46732 RepID=A0AAU9W5P2_9CNID|nr:unnamed protein product [Pocillopora meandrina]